MMKVDEFYELQGKLSEVIGTLEDLETTLISKMGDRCHSAVWMRLTSCYVVLASLQLTQEYNIHFGNEQGGWSLTE